jgi:hypothetical protein
LARGRWPIHHVKEMLGHANISQTDTISMRGAGLHESMKRSTTFVAKPLQKHHVRAPAPWQRKG